ncbi:gliding motility-associated C-terminal domain-containing protein [Myroides odoratus]|uniref:gliding motility-associated C-terminal domain-containing protein n=1 Tax=Myroides odoratus TaxID=256 RepID=UPI0007658031|nr:gliding motility-associated C-terminal domain-containing protein [Myroides odoratus]
MKKKKYTIGLAFGLLAGVVQAQNTAQQVMVNTGVMFVASNETLATRFDFTNTADGKVINDGTVYFFRNFNNDGHYGYSGSKSRTTNSSKAIFKRYEGEEGTQLISGNAFSQFYNIELDNSKPLVAFDLKNNMDVFGTLEFKDGIVKVDESFNPITEGSYGMLTFHEGATAAGTSDRSHAEGKVEKIGNERFEFPIGDQTYFRQAMISAPKSKTDAVVAEYRFNDTAFFETHKTTTGVVKELNNREYWKLEGKSKEVETVILSLSWDERTTLPSLLTDVERDLHILRWDEKQQLWVDEGGVVDMSTRTVSTPAQIKNFGYFTLGTVKADWILEEDVVIYNLVTPDGDGKNDYFIIDNIRKYPNNRVEIYNRWGVKVYETTGYDPNGDGSMNVFNGYSEGKITVDKKKKLPSGTYYYIVTYEYTDANGSRMIKKAANLHLETN